MNRAKITAGLARLSALLAASDVVGKIVIFGGAAMVLAHYARPST